jgi:outer membrane immunogenic protein
MSHLRFTSLLLCSAAIISTPVRADASLEELKAKLERAEKENIVLKTEKVERENVTMKLEKIEAENAALRNEAKVVKTPTASVPSQKTVTAPVNTPVSEAKTLARKEPVETIVRTPREHVLVNREINRALDAIPKDDPHREMMAKAIPSAPVEPVTQTQSPWGGIYAGVNVGYNAGTNSNVTSENWNNQTQAGTGPGGLVQSGSTISTTFTGNASNNQSGFAGGVQLGYNYLTSRLLFGAETDLQGSNTRGTSIIYGDARDQVNSQVTIVLPGGLPPLVLPGTYTGSGVGTNTIQGGVDYIGTVRGRIGYLAKPELLLYGTAGLAYGGAWANYTQLAAYEGQASIAAISSAVQPLQNYNGTGSQTKLLTGWTAGAGAEWMFMPNLSLKGEALYWDLGRMTVNTKALGGDGINKIWGNSSVNYSGIMTRVGLNYHLNLTAPPISTKY